MPNYCAFGPCDNSVDRGGSGCHLCDVVAKMPQQRKADRYADQPRPNGKRARRTEPDSRRKQGA